MSAIINKHNSYDNDRKEQYILQRCLQQWRTNLTIKTIAVVIKTHTITKIKTNNETKEREGGKQWKRGERERREIEDFFSVSCT